MGSENRPKTSELLSNRPNYNLPLHKIGIADDAENDCGRKRRTGSGNVAA